jgi:septin family protein
MYSANTDQAYQDFQQKLDILSSLINQQIQVVKAINNSTQENNLKRLQKLVKSTNFKVMIVGEFNRGKSTFINALLGEEILPSSPTPCTAIINEVKWSETKNAVLHYHEKNDQPSKEPFRVSIDEIEQYVVIDMKDKKESIYKKLELFWPLRFCKNGVEIIDSPGLNEDGIRQQVTESYLSTVDAVIFILSCDQLFTDAERQVIDNKIRYAGHEDIFFVCNYINRIRNKEVEKVKQFALDKLSSRTRLGAQRIFFINALGALDGKIEDDMEALENSGVPPLEVELQKFLTNDRGRVKILRPAQELKNSIREIRKSIPEQKDMLNTDIKELEQRYATAQQPLQNLEAKRNNIVKNLSNSMKDTEQVLSEKTKSFCRELTPKIKTIAQEYKLENKIKLLFTDPRPSIETAIKEISSHLESGSSLLFMLN